MIKKVAQIVSIDEPKGKKGLYRIHLSNDEEFELSREVYFRRNFRVEEIIEIVELKELIREDMKVRARETAMSYLDRGLKSKKEIEDKLKKENFPSDIIDETIKLTENYGFVNDANYARAFVETKISSKGILSLKNSLYKKGIDKEIIEETFGEDFSLREKEILLDTARKKYDSLKKREKDERKLKEKLMRFLLSKGYTYDNIKTALEEVMQQSFEEDYL